MQFSIAYLVPIFNLELFKAGLKFYDGGIKWDFSASASRNATGYKPNILVDSLELNKFSCGSQLLIILNDQTIHCQKVIQHPMIKKH